MRALLCLSLLLVSGCSERPPPPAAPFVAGNAEEAVSRVRSFLDAYVAGEVEGALSHLCEKDARTRTFLERSLAPGSPFRIKSYEVASATPLWEGKQPLYLVLVELPRRSGPPIEYGYRVRAEDGCIERLLGGPQRAPSTLPPSHPSPLHPPPSTLPPSHPSVPPRASPPEERPRDVEERDDGRDRWGPSLPAAPVSPGAEVIEL